MTRFAAAITYCVRVNDHRFGSREHIWPTFVASIDDWNTYSVRDSLRLDFGTDKVSPPASAPTGGTQPAGLRGLGYY